MIATGRVIILPFVAAAQIATENAQIHLLLCLSADEMKRSLWQRPLLHLIAINPFPTVFDTLFLRTKSVTDSNLISHSAIGCT